MRRILSVTLLSLVYVALQAQLISFESLRDGVFDLTKIKKELILNGFTKLTASSNSDTDTYVYNYDETKQKASIWVNITPLFELANAGLYSIDVLTSGDYLHDELLEEITEHCAFKEVGVGDGLVYTCDYAAFVVSSQGGNRLIGAYPNFEKLAEEMTEEELEEFMKAIEEMN